MRQVIIPLWAVMWICLTGTATATVIATPVEKVIDGGGTGTFVVEPPSPNAIVQDYLIEILQSSPGATFRASIDAASSWYGWSGSSWELSLSTGRPVGQSIALPDPNVQISFTEDDSGAFATGDRFSFSIAAVPAAVPEPATIMLLCSGLGLIWWQRRKRR